MRPRPRQPGDDLSAEQRRRLLAISVAVGGLVLLGVLAITGASHVFGPGGGQEGPPDAAFSVQTVERDDGLAANVTHAGGQAVAPADVVVEVAGERRGNWTALGGEGLAVVAPGHSVLVEDVQAGDEVRVLWIGAEETEDEGEKEAVTVLDYDTVRDPSDS